MKPLLDINYCGHSQQAMPWPDADDYWVLVPIVDAVTK